MTRDELDRVFVAREALRFSELKCAAVNKTGDIVIEGNPATLPLRYVQAARMAIRDLALSDLAVLGIVLSD
jgi:hypothetical protein